ncbi:hypothetical protein EVAR_11819_1 [Eumeta japonica]|uniref:Uncharacterized protein n=1 Tax=Eumeta variegata TaxID=151549 RepID=A0A4C1UQV0_EUMVA|nr:hypothetical protein EVAR_11819_1 [Eumeta japonica]
MVSYAWGPLVCLCRAPTNENSMVPLSPPLAGISGTFAYSSVGPAAMFHFETGNFLQMFTTSARPPTRPNNVQRAQAYSGETGPAAGAGLTTICISDETRTPSSARPARSPGRRRPPSERSAPNANNPRFAPETQYRFPPRVSRKLVRGLAVHRARPN